MCLVSQETQTLLFIVLNLHQCCHWRLEIGDMFTNRSVSRIAPNRSFCFWSTSSCREDSFSISFTVQVILQFAAQCLDVLPVWQWFVLRSIKLICINNTNLNLHPLHHKIQDLQIRRVYLVYVYFWNIYLLSQRTIE